MKKSVKRLLLEIVKEKGIVTMIDVYAYKYDYIVVHLLEIKNNPQWYLSKTWETLTYENLWELCLTWFHRSYDQRAIEKAFKFMVKHDIEI